MMSYISIFMPISVKNTALINPFFLVMGQYISTGQVICKRKEDLVRYAWDSVKSNSVNDTIKLEVEVKVRGMYGYTEVSINKEYLEYTPIIIACMFRDVELVRKLIDAGADINLPFRSYKHMSGEEGVPPLYYAIAARDVDIVKLLLDSGADVNKFKGYKQFINLQKPEIEQYSIFQPRYSINLPGISLPPPSPMTRILEVYLMAGAKLNTTCWGHCFFYGRGKVYEANQPTTLDIPGPCFTCDTAILLLQHGMDPDQYKLKDVLQQFSYHNLFNSRRTCVGFNIMLQTFIAAGYRYTSDDLDCSYTKTKMAESGISMEEPPSLKQSCRSLIRKHLRIINKDTTIFPPVNKLPIPTSLKDYLKLCNIIDIKEGLIQCTLKYM
ncbi:uncharacterized protein LOC134266296 [Saccostrea cucullata]|uniref:uncharacterized protein LOC134266296 n=1 Tax=Saccostrea cuccullata TaxID=36930 RepID=UPI002ED496B3